MKLLVTGGQGQVAYDIKKLNSENLEIVALSREQLDITSKETVENFLEKHKPNLIINTAAYTKVDKAEEEKELAFKVNCEAAGLLSQCCSDFNLPLIHLSTDYVFDGEKNSPYKEDDKTNPRSFYGESKLQGEKLIQKYLKRHIILRVSGVFGFHGNNFVKTILKLAEKQKELNVVYDQITCPTHSGDIANVILKIARTLLDGKSFANFGIYHYCASNPTSWFDFAKEILQEASKYNQKFSEIKINPIKSAEFKTLAKRPRHSSLNCDKIKNVFNITQQAWQMGLEKVIRELMK